MKQKSETEAYVANAGMLHTHARTVVKTSVKMKTLNITVAQTRATTKELPVTSPVNNTNDSWEEESLQERFERKFDHELPCDYDYIEGYDCSCWYGTFMAYMELNGIWEFFTKEIERAREEGRKEAIENIKRELDK